MAALVYPSSTHSVFPENANQNVTNAPLFKGSNSSLNHQSPGTGVILIRHGRSTYNEQGRYQGSCDDSILTEQGRKLAYETGLILKELPIDAIYTSPLKRTQQTAHEIIAAISTVNDKLPPLRVAETLKEINIPAWEGLPFQYVREQFSQAYRCWKEHPHQFQMGVSGCGDAEVQRYGGDKGEFYQSQIPNPRFPVLELYAQAQQFWQDILPHHSGQTILIVSHGGTNRALISTAIGLTPNRFHTLQQCNCGMSVLHFPAGVPQSAQLEALNLTAHLGKTLPKLKEGRQGLRLLLIPSGDIHPQQIQKLTQLLEDVTLNFSINHDRDNAQVTAAQILQYHPETLQLQVSRNDFPQVWQQTIDANAASGMMDSQPLLTGLIVASEAILKRFLGQTLGISTNELNHLPLHQGKISVIHYPCANQAPVVQGINIGEIGKMREMGEMRERRISKGTQP
jgi:probable phosphoglycerate mutase